jgi:exosome complex component RRP4
MPEIKRKYVTPGEIIVEGNFRPESNVVRVGDKLLATRVGMAEISHDDVRVIPLSGPYIPRVDDLVIGKVVDYSAFAWEVDINSCFFAYLPAQSVFGREYSPAREPLTKKFAIGDLLIAQVTTFDRTRDPLLTVSGHGLGKVLKGEVVKITPAKVPRLIGKKGSMIKTIEQGTNTRLVIGQNGVVVITGPPENVLQATRVIRLVEQEAHTVDLTQKVELLLSSLQRQEGKISQSSKPEPSEEQGRKNEEIIEVKVENSEPNFGDSESEREREEVAE